MHNTYIYICPLFARAAKRNCQCKDDEPADGGVAGEELVPGVVPLHCRRSQESMQQDLRAAQSSLRGGAADKGRGPEGQRKLNESPAERDSLGFWPFRRLTQAPQSASFGQPQTRTPPPACSWPKPKPKPKPVQSGSDTVRCRVLPVACRLSHVACCSID